MSNKTLVFLAATAASLMMGSIALADEAAPRREAHVAYADLNLSNDAGVTRLYARLKNASTEVCAAPTAAPRLDKRCETRALDQAVADVHNDRLSSLHQRHSDLTKSS